MVRIEASQYRCTDETGGRVFDWLDDPRGLDFIGTVPVPLRQRMHDALQNRLSGQADLAQLKCCFLMGQGGVTPLTRLRRIRSLADYPAMVVSAEYNNLFNREFYARYVAQGAFESGQPDGCDDVFRQSDLIDPKGAVGVFSVAPFVFLIDKIRLGNRPIPRRWSDLFESDYRGEVVFGGWQRSGECGYRAYNKFFLACIAEEFGLGAVAKLCANVPALMHSAQMPRLAGSNASIGAIYVVPWSLADLCPRRDATEVVWPLDGALAYPLWQTIRKDRRENLGDLAQHFFDPAVAEYLDVNRYPSLAPGRTSRMPVGARLKWMGWDFVRSRHSADIVKKSCALFVESQRLQKVTPCI